MASPPTGTLTLLFTDIEGSTRLWEHDDPAMQSGVDPPRRDTQVGHRGSTADTSSRLWGMPSVAVFPTAPDALEAALEIQRRLLTSGWEQTGPLRVRMALHTGAAEERDGDYFGPPVNRVARLLSAAHGGQVLLSLPTQELVRDQLPTQTSLRDLGEHRLKDLFRPERGLPACSLLGCLVDSASSDARRLPQQPPPPTNPPHRAQERGGIGGVRPHPDLEETRCSPSPVRAGLARLGSPCRQQRTSWTTSPTVLSLRHSPHLPKPNCSSRPLLRR